MSSPGGSSAGVTVQEYSVRVPKVTNKQNCVMQFNSSLKVDFTKWNQVKMVREVPVKEVVLEDPKFGAGSEFGKDLREEARRKKLGIIAKKNKPDAYPWMMRVGGKTGKKYRGVRGGSVTENASYYVFTQAKDGAFEACPVAEWYNFQHVQRYKALTAEEAEEQFVKRDKIMNYFSVMVKKRLKNDEEAEEEGEGLGPKEKKKPGKKKKSEEFKLTDMDEWPDSSEGEDDEEEEDEEDGEEKKKKKKRDMKEKQKKKKRKSDIKDEAFEDSDDGDDEGREMDYISDSSESEDDLKPATEEKGVDQEDALKRLLDSDAEVASSSEEEKKSDDEEKKKTEEEQQAAEKKKKSKKKKKKKEAEAEKDEDSPESEGGLDSSDEEKPKTDGTANGAAAAPAAPVSKTEKIVSDLKAQDDGTLSGGRRPGDPASKRKADEMAGLPPVAKRTKLESVPSPQIASDTGITEEAVRRYLTRKPMTTTELLQKFKSKKVGLSSDQLVPVIAQILKKINPNKQTIKGKMYLSIKK